MLVIQVDGFNAEALQAGIARCAHIFGPAVDAARGRIGFVANDSEFRGEKNLGAQCANGHTDQYFIVAVAIDIRGIEKGDAEFDGAVNRRDGLLVVARSIEFGHSHAAETHRRSKRAVFSKLTLWH